MDCEARRTIEDVLIRYATAIDLRDWRLFASCFADDVQTDYGEIGAWHDRASLVDHMSRGHRRYGVTLHRLSNIVVGGDARSASTTCYVDALLMPISIGGTGRRAYGIYRDEFTCRAGQWLIQRHTFIPVSIEDGTAF